MSDVSQIPWNAEMMSPAWMYWYQILYASSVLWLHPAHLGLTQKSYFHSWVWSDVHYLFNVDWSQLFWKLSLSPNHLLYSCFSLLLSGLRILSWSLFPFLIYIWFELVLFTMSKKEVEKELRIFFVFNTGMNGTHCLLGSSVLSISILPLHPWAHNIDLMYQFY